MSVRARREPHPNRSPGTCRDRRRADVRCRARPDPRRRDLRQHHARALHGDPRCVDLHRRDHRHGALGHAERHGTRRRLGQRRRPHPARRPAGAERARRRRGRAVHEHGRRPAPLRRPGRRRGLPLLAVRGTGLPPHVRGVRAARPQGRVQLHVTAPSRWQVVSNSPTPEPHVDGDVATWSFTPTATISSYITGARGRPVRGRPRRADQPRRPHDPARGLRPEVARRVPRPRVRLRHHEEGLRLLRGEVRRPVPVREVRPAVRAGVQRRRDGERRAVTFTETYVFRSKVTDAIKERRVVTILHELAHMWFGDLSP